VLTPYESQKELIQSLLIETAASPSSKLSRDHLSTRNSSDSSYKIQVDVSTIDGFSTTHEPDIVIFSPTRTGNYSPSFSSSSSFSRPDLMYHVLTRARLGFILVGSRSLFGTDKLWSSWLDFASSAGAGDTKRATKAIEEAAQLLHRERKTPITKLSSSEIEGRRGVKEAETFIPKSSLTSAANAYWRALNCGANEVESEAIREEIIRSAFNLESQELDHNHCLRPREWSSIEIAAAISTAAPDTRPYVDG